MGGAWLFVPQIIVFELVSAELSLNSTVSNLITHRLTPFALETVVSGPVPKTQLISAENEISLGEHMAPCRTSSALSHLSDLDNTSRELLFVCLKCELVCEYDDVEE